MVDGIRVTVWNEGVHEKKSAAVRAVYPNGIGWQIARGLENQVGVASVRLAGLDDDGQGLTEAVLDNTDVLVWWGHKAHDQVSDENATRVQQRVLNGMGLVPLHSSHLSKPFVRLMGTGCMLRWRCIGERERVWVVDPSHPIVEGLPPYIDIPHHEMYGEHFDIPAPDDLVFISWYQGGEVFRSGCCWHRGLGKVFYFSPGHETFPIFYDPMILRVILNGVRWAGQRGVRQIERGHFPEPLETILDRIPEPKE